MQQPERGVAAYERRDWREAYDVLSGCASLTAAETDMLAEAAHWVGLPDEIVASAGASRRTWSPRS